MFSIKAIRQDRIEGNIIVVVRLDAVRCKQDEKMSEIRISGFCNILILLKLPVPDRGINCADSTSLRRWGQFAANFVTPLGWNVSDGPVGHGYIPRKLDRSLC
jgi:hypothetical protein